MSLDTQVCMTLKSFNVFTSGTCIISVQCEVQVFYPLSQFSQLFFSIIRSQVKAAGHYDESLPVFDMIYKQKEDGQQHGEKTFFILF